MNIYDSYMFLSVRKSPQIITCDSKYNLNWTKMVTLGK